MYDCTDPTSPLVGLPKDKQQELLGRLKALLVARAQTVDHSEVESLEYKLSAACAATEWGRMYLGRFYARMRNAVEVRLKMTGWLYRNIRWWVLYFEGGAPVEPPVHMRWQFLMAPPFLHCRAQVAVTRALPHCSLFKFLASPCPAT